MIFEFIEVSSNVDIIFDDVDVNGVYVGFSSFNFNIGEINLVIVNIGMNWLNWYGM